MAASKKTQKSLSSFFSSLTTSKTSASSEPSESVHPVCDSTISTEAGEPQKGSMSTEKKVQTQGKNIQTDWLTKYPWLEICDDDGTKKLFCAWCIKACEKNNFTKGTTDTQVNINSSPLSNYLFIFILWGFFFFAWIIRWSDLELDLKEKLEAVSFNINIYCNHNPDQISVLI